MDHERNQVLSIDIIDITALGEFVAKHYQNPRDYFHFDNNDDGENEAGVSDDGGDDDDSDSDDSNDNNSVKNAFKILHLENTKIASESQQNSDNNAKNITHNLEESNKLYDQQKTLESCIFSEKTEYTSHTIHSQEIEPSSHSSKKFKCFYCDDFFSSEVTSRSIGEM